jgi:carboxypeptidase Taq
MEDNMNKTFKKLQPFLDKAMALQTARSLFEWDDQTAAPCEAGEYTSKVIGILSDEYMKSLINDETGVLVKALQSGKEQEELSPTEKAIVKELGKIYNKLEHIPSKEYREFNELTSLSCRKWAKAKKENRYDDFAPYLQKIIEFKKKFASYRAKPGQKLYDVLLEDYEECFDMKELDIFFDKLKASIIPLLKKVSEQSDKIDKSFNYLSYDVTKQKEFCNFLSGYTGFDFNRGIIAESAHPFTLNLHNHDVRITNHFIENNLESAMFSIIHETGHALYEMDIDNSLTQTLVGCGASMGMHESQSRFFENNIGRSRSFWEPLYDKLVKTYPKQLKNVTLDHFIKGINKAKPGLIRTEADELSYSLHIIIRYEIEKLIFDGEITVEELPDVWNEKYKQYLGLTPPDYSSGILQDTHWSMGDFGYFPSYAIGSAVAAQIYYHMEKIMPLQKHLKNSNLTPIRNFLKESIHKYGSVKNTNQILTDMMGEELDADYYISYLTEKYKQLYDL